MDSCRLRAGHCRHTKGVRVLRTSDVARTDGTYRSSASYQVTSAHQVQKALQVAPSHFVCLPYPFSDLCPPQLFPPPIIPSLASEQDQASATRAPSLCSAPSPFLLPFYRTPPAFLPPSPPLRASGRRHRWLHRDSFLLPRARLLTELLPAPVSRQQQQANPRRVRALARRHGHR